MTKPSLSSETNRNPRNADWRGRLERRWRWSTFSREWGRLCYRTNANGDTLESWWEWEPL